MTRALFASPELANCLTTVSKRDGGIAVHIAEQTTQLVECSGIQATMFLDARAGSLAKLANIAATLRDTNHRYIQVPALHHGLKRGEYFLVRQIAGSAEEDQRVRMGFTHRIPLLRITSRRVFPSGRRIRIALPIALCF